MDRKALDVNGGGVIDFYQRFQQLQLQRDTSDELIKVCSAALAHVSCHLFVLRLLLFLCRVSCPLVRVHH